ncbi:MAG: OsmC family peroxiredoxin [Promicromonosporaceae bacterium]|nr:OsmC family peroxiredoxin [Promicromonosporaceae bacterium]
MGVHHEYDIALDWTDPNGTRSYSSYTRDHQVRAAGKAHAIEASSPERFRGSPTRYSPGELLTAAISSGHMMRFLEVSSQVGLVVLEYRDHAHGLAELGSRGDGAVNCCVLRPRLVVRQGPFANDVEVARLHERAQSMSVIATSVSLEVQVQPAGLEVVPA